MKKTFTIYKLNRSQNSMYFEIANNILFHSHIKCLRLFNKKFVGAFYCSNGGYYMLENLTKTQKIIFGIIIIFMIFVIIYYIYSTLNNIEYETDIISNNSISDIDDSDIEYDSIDKNVTETKEILVHVSGCVKEEKIVSLPDGSRINDAIEAVGRTY